MAQLDNVWRQQRLSLSTKLRIYTSLVQSVVLYGSKTWTMRKVDNWQDPVFSYAGSCIVSLASDGDKVANAVVNERTKLPDLPSLIADSWRHSLFGHICRHGTKEHTCFACTATVNRSPHWHSPCRWLTVRRVVHGEHGCSKWKKCLSVGAAQIASQDRSMWRTLRPSAGQAQQWVSECLFTCVSYAEARLSYRWTIN